MSAWPPGPGWWRGQDGHWYPPPPYQRAPASSEPERPEPGPGKEERSRALREWIQTGQGVATLIVSIIALGGVGAGAAIASGGRASSQSPGPAPSVTAVGASPGASTLAGSPAAVSSAQLAQALLPAQDMGATAIIKVKGTSLSNVIGICGAPLPGGAQAAAFELLQDSQSGQDLSESIVDWGTASEASEMITEDRTAVDQSGSCVYTNSNATTKNQGDFTSTIPSGCADPGEYLGNRVLVTTSSLPSALISGFRSEVQCGSFTLTVQVLGVQRAGVDQDLVDGYLSNAVGRFDATVR